MMKNIKNIRKLDNARLLVVSSDKEILNTLNDEFVNEFKNFVLTSDLNEALSLSRSGNFDMVVIDTSIEGSFLKISEEITLSSPALPKIIISGEYQHENIITAINCSAYTF
ncbi:MAG: DNA-binding response regulator, partial [Campylobacteraceae bacterium]|nr:DNA-binding response regulator [Campylobacteraceae bacterium]